ncbi:MAG: hypothetical protein OCC45_08560 [Desulfotalea sp.]
MPHNNKVLVNKPNGIMPDVPAILSELPEHILKNAVIDFDTKVEGISLSLDGTVEIAKVTTKITVSPLDES